MATELERLQVVIDATSDPLRKELKSIREFIREFKKGIKEGLDEVKVPKPEVPKPEIPKPDVPDMPELPKPEIPDPDPVEPEVNTEDALTKLQKLKLAIKAFAADAKVNTGLFEYTDEFKILSADVQKAQQEIRELEMAKKAAAMYHGEDSDEYRELADEADEARQDLERLFRVMQKVSKESGFTKFKGGIAVIRRLGSAVGSVGKRLGQLAGGAIRKAGGAFGALIKRMASASMAGRLLSRVFGGGAGGGGLVSSILKVTGVLAIAKAALAGLRAAFNWMKEGIKEGFENMVKAMPTGELARNMATLKNSLSQLKGALASAAAPIFNALAPALNSLIQMAVKAANAVGALMAALTGKKYVVAATGAASDYSSGLADTADNASAAKDAVDELKKSLMGFDAINKLDDNDSSSSSGSGGSGGGSGGSGGGISGGFEEVGIPDEVKAFADKIKEAWKNADFTEIGTIVGTKLKNALDGIRWDEIKTTCNKVAKSVATFLNGFFETPGLFTSIGTTAAEGVNTALGALNTFAYNFHWDSLGKAISDSVNGFFKTFEWKLAADTFSNWAKGVFTAMYTALENIDWREIGRGLKEFLKNVDWNGIADAMFEAIGAAIGGIASFFVGLFEEVPGAIKKYFADHIQDAKDAGGNIVTGIFSGITDALKAIGTWIKEHIFDPFIEGFKKAFGIASPSKEMKPLGENIIEGLLEGIKGAITAVKEFITDLPAKVKEWFGNVKDLAVSVAVNLGKTWKTVASWVSGFMGDAVSKGIGIVQSGWSKVSKWIKDSYMGGAVSKGIGIAQSGWSKVSKWISDSYMGGAVSKKIGLKRSFGKGIKTVKGWVESSANWGKGIYKNIGLRRSGWSTVTAWVQKHFGSGLSVGVSLNGGKKAEGGVYMQGGWKPIQRYAGGGLPGSGQMFIAREAGPELVGNLGGNTAVMNNNQIVASVASGVYRAVSAAFHGFNRNQGTIPEIHVYVGGSELTDYVIKDVNNRTIATGRPQFIQ